MNLEQYFKSLSQELTALKNRVRNFIENKHWLTDGEWKESVLRSVLSRNLPNDIMMGRGFILTPSQISTQIDILFYAADAPVLFRDGNLVFVQPSAVRGIIEVKTKMNPYRLKKAVKKMAALGEIFPDNAKLFLAIFSYDSDNLDGSSVLKILQRATRSENMIINHLCLGDSFFIRYWEGDPQYGGDSGYEKWHSYSIPDMAYGYFIHNLLHSLSPRYIEQHQNMWFPPEGKERYKTGDIQRKRGVEEPRRIEDVINSL
jgi:hypothetical protein